MLTTPGPAITHRMQLVIMITAAVVVISAKLSMARELRPSDHGLEYQTAPPVSKSPPEMEEFFGALNAPPPPSPLALPWAKSSSNDTSWWRSNTGRNGGGGVALGGHARRVLVVLSFVCGVAGLVLLVASGLVHLVRRMKNKNQTASVSTAAEDNNGGNGSRSVVSK